MAKSRLVTSILLHGGKVRKKLSDWSNHYLSVPRPAEQVVPVPARRIVVVFSNTIDSASPSGDIERSETKEINGQIHIVTTRLARTISPSLHLSLQEDDSIESIPASPQSDNSEENEVTAFQKDLTEDPVRRPRKLLESCSTPSFNLQAN